MILDALVRGGGNSQAIVLADSDGVRASISEQGAHRVGKDYEVEPIAVTNGVFHPKVSVFISADECPVLVGSGNLTFGGWGGNCEALEHLHVGFAADAIADVAEFFEKICGNTRIRHGAAAYCAAIAADLRGSLQGRAGNGDIRFLHNLDRSIIEQVADAAADLGGAERLVAAALFWDGQSAAVSRIPERAAAYCCAYMSSSMRAAGRSRQARGWVWPPVRQTTVWGPRSASRASVACFTLSHRLLDDRSSLRFGGAEVKEAPFPFDRLIQPRCGGKQLAQASPRPRDRPRERIR